jgi:membrane dipeptidase
MLVDVSHASDACIADVLRVSRPRDRLAFVRAGAGATQAQPDRRGIARHRRERRRRTGGGLPRIRQGRPGALCRRGEAEGSVAKAAGDDEFDSEKHDRFRAYVQGMAAIEQRWPRATLADFLDHVPYMVKVAGIDHVGIASDFDGRGGVTGWMDASETANVAARLRARGFGDGDIAKLWGGNLLRAWERADAVALPGGSRTTPWRLS